MLGLQIGTGIRRFVVTNVRNIVDGTPVWGLAERDFRSRSVRKHIRIMVSIIGVWQHLGLMRVKLKIGCAKHYSGIEGVHNRLGQYDLLNKSSYMHQPLPT